jgi:biopolymer transport protein ExbB/TolQ
METTLLVKWIVILSVLLSILVVFLVYSKNVKKKRKAKEQEKQQKQETKHNYEYPTLKELYKVVRNRKSTAQELKEALDLVIKHYGKIHPKLGMRTHPDFDTYSAIMFTLCRHPNTNKDLIINFDRELEKLNPDYVMEINDALEKGLNSRTS